jgi:hypothetical protein
MKAAKGEQLLAIHHSLNVLESVVPFSVLNIRFTFLWNNQYVAVKTPIVSRQMFVKNCRRHVLSVIKYSKMFDKTKIFSIQFSLN